MLAPQSLAAVRKGTKSCTECRRRKVRCVRIPEDAPTCRQCAERNTACVAQTSSPRPKQQRLSSRYRIAQLESQVTRLTRIVSGIEVKLGGKPSLQQEQHIGPSPGSDDSDGESSASEILMTDEPSHLRSLFQNDWLTVDTRRHHEQLEERRVKASSHLVEIARPALRKLIPPKEETANMLVFTYDWLHMLHAMLPQPSVPNSLQKVLEHYDEMCQPDVNVVTLASWLLTVAIIAQQVPQGSDNKDTQKRLDFARAVSDTVENLIMTHDRLVGTFQGLGMAIHFIRLQMGRGNPQKAWLRLRHVIALAELMGLPKAAQLARLRTINGAVNEGTRDDKFQLWEIICTIDRMAGLLINLPPYTRRYPLPTPPALMIDGVVQPAVYLSRLVDIAPKIADLEDLSLTQGSTTRLYTSALEIAREAKELMSLTPKAWWTINATDDLRPEHIVQFIHYCVVMKAHLPVALRQDQSEEYLYSRLACMDACEAVAHRYQFLRRKLPSGFFTLRLLDLQVFTAMVLLLLASHTYPSTDQRSFQIDKVRLEGVVSEIIELMQEKSKDGLGADFSERGANTLCALRDLLQQDDSNASRVQELTVNVPLLGKIHIRRNQPTAQASGPPAGPSSDVPQPSNWKSRDQIVSAAYNPSFSASTYMQNAIPPGQTGPGMQWDHLSWFIESTGDNLFDDALMAENFDQGALWQNTYYNIPFS